MSEQGGRFLGIPPTCYNGRRRTMAIEIDKLYGVMKKGWPWAVLLVSCLIGGIVWDAPLPTQPSQEMADNPAVKSFVAMTRLIEAHYVLPPDREGLTRGAVTGMLRSLDPHSNFFDRREFSEMQDEQNSKFYGIGVTINQRNNRIYVIGVSRGMPAALAGLRYGDAIVAVDGKSTKAWSQSDALKNVRGERGTAVEITVERAGVASPLTFKIVRDEVPYPSVRNYFLLRPGVGYIGLTGGFNLETTRELHRAIDELKRQGMKSLVLDLRRNPGGLLKQAIQVSETFLERSAEIVSIRGREGRSPRHVYRSENGAPETMPLAILIDGETASASEIVAGAMQDHGRARIVGEESFGKGLVQTVYRLRGGTGLTLTTARYFTPAGRSIQRAYVGGGIYDYLFARRHESRNGEAKTNRGGIEPDLAVKRPEEKIRLRDACFEFARGLSAGLYPELAAYQVGQMEYGRRLRGSEYQLSDRVLWQFRQYLREHPELQVSEAQAEENWDYVKRRIRAEVITAAYGIEVAEQFLLESDLQALKAIESMK